jgi:hypothetical protein
MKKTFEQWKQQVDLEVRVRCGGLSADDLDDWRYTDDWREGLSPKRSAARAIKNAKEACGF